MKTIIYSLLIEKSVVFVKIFDFSLLMDLQTLGYSKHDMIIFKKCLSVCFYVCDKNFMASVIRELMHFIS